jgi:hypothetical protein
MSQKTHFSKILTSIYLKWPTVSLLRFAFDMVEYVCMVSHWCSKAKRESETVGHFRYIEVKILEKCVFCDILTLWYVAENGQSILVASIVNFSSEYSYKLQSTAEYTDVTFKITSRLAPDKNTRKDDRIGCSH